MFHEGADDLPCHSAAQHIAVPLINWIGKHSRGIGRGVVQVRGGNSAGEAIDRMK